MSDDDRSFEQAFRRNLGPAQRREVLATLRETLRRDTTLGEVLDAAETLGWGEAMGDLRLADLARALIERESGGARGDTTQPVSASAHAVAPSAAKAPAKAERAAKARATKAPAGPATKRKGARASAHDDGLAALLGDDRSDEGEEVFAGDLVAEVEPSSGKGPGRRGGAAPSMPASKAKAPKATADPGAKKSPKPAAKKVAARAPASPVGRAPAKAKKPSARARAGTKAKAPAPSRAKRR